MKGNSFANGVSMNNGPNAQTGSSLLQLVRSWQGAGFNVRSASIWDYLEPGLNV